MVDFKSLLIDTFKDPIEGWFNPAHDALVRNEYFRSTGSRLPNVAKVERFDPRIVENIKNRGVGWYNKVNIPPSSKLINQTQYLVPRNKIVPYVANAKAPAKIFIQRAAGLTPQGVIFTGAGWMMADAINKERAKEESRKRIEGYRNFHTGPAYIGYPDTPEGRASKWAAEILMGK